MAFDEIQPTDLNRTSSPRRDRSEVGKGAGGCHEADQENDNDAMLEPTHACRFNRLGKAEGFMGVSHGHFSVVTASLAQALLRLR